MTETITLKAENRTELGTNHARKMREVGLLPGIIYGHGADPVSITLQSHEVEVALAHHAKHVKLDLDGKPTQCLIRDVQYDHLDSKLVHIDLIRVSLTERVTVTVGVELKGTPKGVEVDGGVLDQQLTEIDVECVVTNIPEMFSPLVTHLELGEAFLAKDIKLPEGVTLVTDPEERIATVKQPEEESEETAVDAAEGEEGASEPEVIGRGKKEEEESEE